MLGQQEFLILRQNVGPCEGFELLFRPRAQGGGQLIISKQVCDALSTVIDRFNIGAPLPATQELKSLFMARMALPAPKASTNEGLVSPTRWPWM